MDGDPDAEMSHPLYGRNICFTGTMYSMPRTQAAEEVCHCGANFRTNVSKKLDYLVIGDADFVAFADGWRTGKLDRALELRDEGAPIEIVSERDFLALLQS
jgi:DNA polymerase-3 subunit epsilon